MDYGKFLSEYNGFSDFGLDDDIEFLRFNALVLIAEVPSSAFRLIPFVPAVIGSSIAIVIAVASVKLVLGWGNQ